MACETGLGQSQTDHAVRWQNQEFWPWHPSYANDGPEAQVRVSPTGGFLSQVSVRGREPRASRLVMMVISAQVR